MSLQIGREYSWEELGHQFGFKPNLFSVGGGMISVRGGPLLLITHPGGAKSFDYQDRWEGDQLIYTGRGQRGDQQLDGPNREVAENRRPLEVFEAAGPRRLRYLGAAQSVACWVARAPDADRVERNVFKYRLHFLEGKKSKNERTQIKAEASFPARREHPFHPGDANRALELRGALSTPEERLALQEKAGNQHQQVLNALAAYLGRTGWSDLVEIPGAFDLAARDAGGFRVIFEVKTISENEVSQMRAALSQLLEYRHFWADPSDGLCIVTSAPVGDRRAALLAALGVGLWCADSDGVFAPVVTVGQHVVGTTAPLGAPLPSGRASSAARQ